MNNSLTQIIVNVISKLFNLINISKDTYNTLEERLDDIEFFNDHIPMYTSSQKNLNNVLSDHIEMILPNSEYIAKNISIDVLKFNQGEHNKILTECEFDVKDKSKFEENSVVSFDGTMHLNKEYTASMSLVEVNHNTIIYTAIINRNSYKSIDKVEVI